MKTFLPEIALVTAFLSSVLCVGCQGQKANAEEVSVLSNPAPVIVVAAAETKPVVAATPPSAIPAVVPPGSIIITNEPAKVAEASPAIVPPIEDVPVVTAANATTTNALPEVVPPGELQLSPALTEVIKLVQSGVGEDVLAAYITNSADIFDIGANEILYLHDLGVPGNIITTLIQQDSSPETMAHRHAMNSAKPLPPGVSLTTPATNIYPPVTAQQPPPEPADQTASTATEIPPNAPGDTAPATVYTVPPVQESVTVNQFHTDLAPYGTWIDVAGYGRCWRPTVAVWNSSWRPYADGGRWVWSTSGWYWYSDYSWGWAPFHYGRWTSHHGVGWFWVPDVHWGPAWVSWRSTRSHSGWAPLPPSARWVSGHGFYHNRVSVGVSFEFGLSDHHYVYIPTSRFCDRRPSAHYVAHHHARSIHRESIVANNYVTQNNTIVNNGVGYDRVARETRGTIRQAAIRQSNESPRGTRRREMLDNDGRTLTVARPSASATTASIRSPNRPVNGLSGARSQNGRELSSSAASTPTTRTRDTASAPQADLSRSPKPIIMRGNGRGGGESRTGTVNPTASANANVTTPRNSPRQFTGQSSTPETPAVRSADVPRGGRPSPRQVERPSTTVAVARPATVPAPVVRTPTPTPAPTVRIPAPAARPQPTRSYTQPTTPRSSRSTVTTVPSVSPAPRQAPSAPRYSPSQRQAEAPRVTAPRASNPSPSPSPRVSAPRASSPAPAPAARPAPSRSSRSSGDDNGRRGSR